jgi:serpin B
MATTALTGHAPAIQALAARWLRLLADDADGDFACSPAGLWLALAAIAAGARGETAEELRGLLGVAGSEAAPAVTDAVRALAATDALAVATGMWSAVPVEDGYRAALPDIGFGELDGSAGIHEWVRKATDGLIERAPAEPAPDTALMLVSTRLRSRLVGRIRSTASTPRTASSRTPTAAAGRWP